MLTKTRVYLATCCAVVSALFATTSAFAVPTLPDATAELTAISTGITSYSTVMFLIAITAVGIMVGVKWIKRGKGAA